MWRETQSKEREELTSRSQKLEAIIQEKEKTQESNEQLVK